MTSRLAIFFVFSSYLAQAFPINFSRNQGELEYDEIVSEHFYFYHDKDVPNESLLLLNSLESSVPNLNKWFDVKLKDPMLVISSSKTSDASFANFFAHTIELQTLGRGGRDLAWHELTHMFMYEKFDYKFLRFFLGKSSTILHLLWMPVWLIEGLAETLSRSGGSAEMASLERYHALSGDWPSYDRLHSLYDVGSFAGRGYATSGAFVTWLLSKKEKNIMPTLLEDIGKYSMPWYYLWGFNPFSSFLPVDYSLELQFKKQGRELYQDYKKEAKEYWAVNAREPSFILENADKLSLKTYWPLRIQGNMSYLIGSRDSKITKQKLVFDKKTGWLIGLRPFGAEYETWFDANTLIEGPLNNFVVQYDRDLKYGKTIKKIVRLSSKKKLKTFENNKETYSYFKDEKTIYSPKSSIRDMYQTEKKILWFENEKEKSRLCQVDKSLFMDTKGLSPKDISCPLERSFPKSLKIVGYETKKESKESQIVDFIWYLDLEEDLQGENFNLVKWHVETGEKTEISYPYGGTIKKIVKHEEGYLFLVSTLSRQVVLKTNYNGLCLGRYEFSDYLLDIDAYENNSLLLSFYRGGLKSIKKIELKDLEQKPCAYYKSHDSPLLYANRVESSSSGFVEALKKSSYRSSHLKEIESVSLENSLKEKKKIFKPVMRKDIKPSTFRARSLFYLPILLNPDNIYEPGIGVFTIPFMDHLQNHQVWVNAFWNFKTLPNLDIEYRLTRFWPTFVFSLYREVQWNGYEFALIKDKDQFQARRVSSYLSVFGGKAKVNYMWYTKKTTTSLTGALSISNRTDITKVPHDKTIEGPLFLPSLSLSHLIRFDTVSLSFGLRGNYGLPVAPSLFNFHTIGLDVAVRKSLSFLKSSFSFSLSGATTRGDRNKTPLLRQYYTFLKTYIPSGSGGVSDSSYRLFGPSFLFQPLLGDDKVRAELKWSFPVISEINRLWWIFFLKSLDFSSQFSYGGIWPKGSFNFKRLHFSHAYNLDLQLGNKGVNVYGGLGLGQLVDMQLGHPRVTWPAFYIRFGFNALF